MRPKFKELLVLNLEPGFLYKKHVLLFYSICSVKLFSLEGELGRLGEKDLMLQYSNRPWCLP